MIKYKDTHYEVAKNLFTLVIALSKRDIMAVFDYNPLGISHFGIVNQENGMYLYFRIFSNGSDWTALYEELSEEIKPIIERIENGTN